MLNKYLSLKRKNFNKCLNFIVTPFTKFINNNFYEHPKNVCMNYSTHMKFSSNLGYNLLIASGKAFIHALIPSCYITSSSDFSKYLDNELKNNGCNKKEN